MTALLDHALERLRALDAADERVAAGTFGRCEVCGRTIGEERLAALPEAVRCVACAATPPRRSGLRS